MEDRSALPTLRASLDSNDTFLNRGHRIMKTAGATRHAERMKRVPVWALDDQKLKEYVDIKFPKARTDPRQRAAAARLIRIIYLYYRVGATQGMISEELKMTPGAVKQAIHRIEKAMKRPLRGDGRPKNPVTIDTSSGVRL